MNLKYLISYETTKRQFFLYFDLRMQAQMTKLQRRQNIADDKTLEMTEYCKRQNTDKIDFFTAHTTDDKTLKSEMTI